MALKMDPRTLSKEALALIAHRFKVLSDVTRLKLLIELEQGEKNVTELVKATGVAQVNISHLQALSDAGLVSRRRDGVKIYYSISDTSIFALCQHVCGSLEKRLKKQAQTAQLFPRQEDSR